MFRIVTVDGMLFKVKVITSLKNIMTILKDPYSKCIGLDEYSNYHCYLSRNNTFYAIPNI